MRYKLAVEKLRLLAEASDIEVRRQPPAAVAVQQRRQADGHFPDKCAILIVILYLSGIKRYSVKLNHDALRTSSLS